MLVLKVIFGQGYLWNDCFDVPDEDVSFRRWQPNLWNLVWALPLIAVGAILVADGSTVFGPLFLVTGTALGLSSTDFFAVQRFAGSGAFWMSARWAAASITALGFVAMLLLWLVVKLWRLYDGSFSMRGWSTLVLAGSFMVFFGSMILHELERRYLFFANPRRYGDMLVEPNWDPKQLWLETYWKLPVEIVRRVFARRDQPV
jgi:hypothetical protein